MNTILRTFGLCSVLALVAGFIVVVLLSIATDLILHAAGLLPPLGQRTSNGLLILATAYRTAYGIAGSYVTARLAPYQPMQHALLGGFVGLILSIAGAIATWNRPETFGAHWYPVALVLLALPTAWAGGRIRLMQLHQEQLA